MTLSKGTGRAQDTTAPKHDSISDSTLSSDDDLSSSGASADSLDTIITGTKSRAQRDAKVRDAGAFLRGNSVDPEGSRFAPRGGQQASKALRARRNQEVEVLRQDDFGTNWQIREPDIAARRALKVEEVHAFVQGNGARGNRLTTAAKLLAVQNRSDVTEYMEGAQTDEDWAHLLKELVDDGIQLFSWDSPNAADTCARHEADRLKKQLGDYQIGEYPDQVKQLLSQPGVKAALFTGIAKYQEGKANLVAKYRARYTDLDPQRPTFFREALINYLTRRQSDRALPSYLGDDEVRTQHPKEAAISLKDLLGPEGAALFQMALREEVNSPEYREACLASSLGHVKDMAWSKRPTMAIGGPSASGKTFATQAAMEKFGESFGQASPGAEGMYVSIDGGVARATSQIRKYVTQLAIRQGFTGVSDLYAKSGKILENVKDIVFDAAKDAGNLGIAIPETFSGYVPPKSKPTLVRELLSIPGSQFVPVRVCPPKRQNGNTEFKKSVAFQGSLRAFKTKDFSQSLVDLNIDGSDVPESKSYNPYGFYFARVGSSRFEGEFKNKSPYMRVINDRVLIKPNAAGTDFVSAVAGDAGAFLCSQSMLDKWRASDRSEALKDYQKTHHSRPIIEMHYPTVVNGAATTDKTGPKQPQVVAKTKVLSAKEFQDMTKVAAQFLQTCDAGELSNAGDDAAPFSATDERYATDIGELNRATELLADFRNREFESLDQDDMDSFNEAVTQIRSAADHIMRDNLPMLTTPEQVSHVMNRSNGLDESLNSIKLAMQVAEDKRLFALAQKQRDAQAAEDQTAIADQIDYQQPMLQAENLDALKTAMATFLDTFGAGHVVGGAQDAFDTSDENYRADVDRINNSFEDLQKIVSGTYFWEGEMNPKARGDAEVIIIHNGLGLLMSAAGDIYHKAVLPTQTDQVMALTAARKQLLDAVFDAKLAYKNTQEIRRRAMLSTSP